MAAAVAVGITQILHHQELMDLAVAAEWAKVVVALVPQALPDRDLLVVLQVATLAVGQLTEVAAAAEQVVLELVVLAEPLVQVRAVME